MRTFVSTSEWEIQEAEYQIRNHFYNRNDINTLHVYLDLRYNRIEIRTDKDNSRKTFKYLGSVKKTKMEKYTLAALYKDARSLNSVGHINLIYRTTAKSTYKKSFTDEIEKKSFVKEVKNNHYSKLGAYLYSTDIINYMINR